MTVGSLTMNQLEDKILKHSTKLYLKYGLRSVSMDDIARSLSISKKTLYQYVGNKESLIALAADCLSSTFSTQLIYFTKQTDSNGKEYLSSIAVYILTFTQKNYRFLKDLERYHHSVWDDFDKKQKRQILITLNEIYPKLSSSGKLKDAVTKGVFNFIFLNACRLKDHKQSDGHNWKYERKALELLIDGLFLL